MIYKFKTEDIRDYQKLVELFENLRDGNVYQKEVLKNQIKSKSDLRAIKKGNQKFKSVVQITAIQNVKNYFGLREKKLSNFLELFFFAV